METNTDEIISFLWNDTMKLITETHDDPKMIAWLKLLKPIELTSNKLVLVCELQWPARKIMSDYKADIERCLKEITFEDIDIHIEIDPSKFDASEIEISKPEVVEYMAPQRQPEPIYVQPQPTQVEKVGRNLKTEVNSTIPTNVSMKTFDTLVTGEANKMAVNFAHRVAELPGQDSFNPFYVYGKSGTGKTHLLLAILNHIEMTQPHLKTLYVTSEQFTNDYIREIGESKKTQSGLPIMRNYENVDVLLVDDVQFFEGKEETITYFFHYFNRVKAEGKQIILSADRPPKDLTLDERMTSRFNEGLLTPISPPTIEMKTAIIRALYHNMTQTDPWYKIQIDESILFYMAEISSSNVREIEGFFTSVMVLAEQLASEDLEITRDHVRQQAEESFNLNYLHKVSIQTIQKEVEKNLNVTHEDMIGSSRKKHINFARQVAMFLSRELTDEPFAAIGEKFGRRDHTTIINGVKNIKERVENDRVFYEQIETLKNRIRRMS